MKATHIQKLLRPIDQAYTEMFSGEVHLIGKGAAAVRKHSAKARNTVIGVHGFLENHAYFTQTYQAPDTELILLTCSHYHIPVSGPTPKQAPWQQVIKYLEATIEYDASILNQALENLPSTGRIRVHGHSRGGAVVLEAVSQRPDLYRDVDVVLEAPVLPQARLHPLVTTLLEPVSHGMWPWVIRLINATPSTSYGQPFFGKITPRKQQLLDKLFSTTRDHFTIVRNIENILDWMEKTDHSVYNHLQHGTILIPKVDRILCRDWMLKSAENSRNHIRIVETGATSHFVTLDSQKWVPSLDLVPEAMMASA